MFRQVARPLNPIGAARYPFPLAATLDGALLLETRARDLAFVMDVWQRNVLRMAPAAPLAGPQPFPALSAPALARIGIVPPPLPGMAAVVIADLIRPHAIYALMVENTMLVSIWKKVIDKFRRGEDAVPSVATQRWLEATQELFFSWDTPEPFRSPETRSLDRDGARRLLYYRLFAMDVGFEPEDGKRDYPRPEIANSSFVTTFEHFLREVWQGHENSLNIAGPRPTDDASIASLASQLHDMLLARRVGNTVDRDEFFAGCMMEWLHLPLEWDSPIVLSLSANGPSPAERLRKIAARVGAPMHAKTRVFLELADDLSIIMLNIEAGAFNTVATAANTYTPAVGNPIPAIMNRIIVNWFAATGRDLKARTVNVERALRPVA